MRCSAVRSRGIHRSSIARSRRPVASTSASSRRAVSSATACRAAAPSASRYAAAASTSAAVPTVAACRRRAAAPDGRLRRVSHTHHDRPGHVRQRGLVGHGLAESALPGQQRRAQQPRLRLRAQPSPLGARVLDGHVSALLLATEDAELAVEQVHAAFGGVQAPEQPDAAGAPRGYPQRPAHGPLRPSAPLPRTAP